MSTKSAPNRLQLGVAKEIRVALARQDRRASDLARSLQVADKWVSQRLRGITPMTVDDLERIAQALDVSPSDLLPSDIHQDGRVTARYRGQAKQLDQQCTFGRPLVSDESPERIDQDSRPRRLLAHVPAMSIAQAIAA